MRWPPSIAMLQNMQMKAGFRRPGPTEREGGSWIPEKAAKIDPIFRHRYSGQLESDNRDCCMRIVNSTPSSYTPFAVAYRVLVAKVL